MDFLSSHYRLQSKGSNKGQLANPQKSIFLQGSVFETTTDILLRNGYDYFIHTLIGEFIKSHKHHSAAFARCGGALTSKC